MMLHQVNQQLKFSLQGMIGNSCIKLIKYHFQSVEGVQLEKVELGKVSLSYDPGLLTPSEIENHFANLEFPVVKDRQEVLFEQLLNAIITFINDGNYLRCHYKNSDYLSDKLAIPYNKLSKVFSARAGITIERFLIFLKLEKVKEKLLEDQYTLGEIAEKLNYSSVHYLSNQFKKYTGISPREFKKSPEKCRLANSFSTAKFHTKNRKFHK